MEWNLVCGPGLEPGEPLRFERSDFTICPAARGGEEARTLTGLLPRMFRTRASTDFTTPPSMLYIHTSIRYHSFCVEAYRKYNRERMRVRRARLKLAAASTNLVCPVGVEPTDLQTLDLATLPFCPRARNSVAINGWYENP
jgi:hypothetical protein